MRSMCRIHRHGAWSFRSYNPSRAAHCSPSIALPNYESTFSTHNAQAALGRVFLSQRGQAATNERGCWEFPGGKVALGETLKTTITREFQEEYGMEIEVGELLGVSDHILVAERQHWVSPTYLAIYVGGEPEIREPEKCSA